MEYLSFEEYSRKARTLAHKVFEDVPEGYEIDHILSIKDAFEKCIPVDLVSHPANLRLLTRHDNRAKGSRSDIGEFELCARIAQHRKETERSGQGK